MDNCNHQFCGPCIFKWVEESENKCPACKAKITKIKYISANEGKKIVKIQEKEQEEKVDDEPYKCDVCNQILRDSDFEDTSSNVNQAAVCECCLEKATHLRCMSLQNAAVFANCFEWLCLTCIDYMENLGISESE